MRKSMKPRAQRRLILLVLFAAFGIGMHILAPTANGLKFEGVPLGYFLAAQGGPILMALLLVWLTAGRRDTVSESGPSE
jgi:putative solute:sodium symporter small subunit